MMAALGPRHLTLRIMLNGELLDGVISAHLSSAAGHMAGRFVVRCASHSAVNAGIIQQPGLIVDVQFGCNGNWQSLTQGAVDTLQLDPIRGELRLEGRDFTSLFIAARTREMYPNRTAGEIATMLAQRRGLQAAVTPTSTLVGRYFEAEHSRMVLDQFARAGTEWDLLVWLAQQEGFDVYVNGRTLCFLPRSGNTVPVFELRPADCLSLYLDHSLALAQGVEVTVRSWNSLQGGGCSATASAGTSGEGTQRYVFVRPNLVASQAERMAQSILSDLCPHEWQIQATVPGELLLTTRDAIAFCGTGTAFDRVYQVSSIERSIDERGFIERLRLNGRMGVVTTRTQSIGAG